MKRFWWLGWALFFAVGANVSHAAITYVGTSAVSQSSTSLSITPPAGSVGDLVICTASNRNASLTLPTPSGASYTELIPGSTWSFHKAWGRIATGSDVFTLAALPGYTEAWCSRYAGTNSNLAAIVDGSITKRTSLTSQIRLGSLTPPSNNEVMWYSTRLPGPGTASPVVDVPTNFTEDVDSYYSGADLIMSGGHWIQTTKTNSPQQDLNVTPAAGAATSNTSILLSLSPSGTGGGGGGGIWSLVGYGAATGVAAGGTLTPALPAGHTTGDWLCWYGAERNTANTLAHPAGYTNVVSRQNAGHDISAIDCKIDGGAEVAPSTTAVGVGMAQMAAYRGGPGVVAGNINATNSSTTTCTTSPVSVSLAVTQSNVLILSFATQQANYTSFTPSTGVPAGYANGVSDASVSYTNPSGQDFSFLLAYYIYPFNTTLSAGNFTDGNVASVACRSHVAGILNPSLAPTITLVNGGTNTFADGAAGVTVTGTNFGAVTGTLQLIDGSTTSNQTVTGWTDTTITFTAVLGGCRYGARSIKVIRNDNSNFNVHDAIITAPSGKCYFDTSTLLQPFAVDKNGAPNRFGDAVAANDITDNSEIELSNLTFSGVSSCANITVNSNASYKVPMDLQSFDWRWNNGGGWASTAADRTGQGKVHIAGSNGFRSSCNNFGGSSTPGIPPRTQATKTICVSGCDYPNTTLGVSNCMAVLGNGQSCEMRDQVGGVAETWTQPIVIAGIHGIEGSVKTLRVQDGDTVIVSGTTSTGVPLLNINNSDHINVQGNSTGSTGLFIGDPSIWNVNCAQATTAPGFVAPYNCFPNGMNTDVTSSNDIGFMNFTLGGATDRVATRIEKTASYVYFKSMVVDLHGNNNDHAVPTPAEDGLLFEQDSDQFMAEDSQWSHSGSPALKVTGSYNVFRRITVDNGWSDLTGDTTIYRGAETLEIVSNDCSDANFGCAPYGPVMVEDSEFRGSGLTPSHSPWNTATELKGIGVIFRKNYIYGNDRNYLVSMCGSVDGTTTAYREGEQQLYHNTLFGGANFWSGGNGYPAGINTAICQKMIIKNNLMQGNQPGQKSSSDIYAFTAKLSGVPLGGYANQWKGAVIANNIFGSDPLVPSLNMQANLTGTGANTVALTNSVTWPANFFNNNNVTMTWANGTTSPDPSRNGLVLGSTNSVGVGDAPAVTTTANAGTAVTSITLTDARAFKDLWNFSGHGWGGWHVEYGDCISVGPTTGSTNVQAVNTQITAINYSTGVVTVTPAVTFQNGSPVWKAIDNVDGTCGRIWRNRGAFQ